MLWPTIVSLRRSLISKHIFRIYRRVMPTMSRTEREAIAAGTVTWEGELFQGKPNWQKLFTSVAPRLTEEEQAFIDGPLAQLCAMIDDWDIVHHRKDLPPEMWQFLKEKGFFGLIIPKQYGGKQFSALAHSEIITKISGLSVTVSSTVSVPNSLGPAELLLHYGTEEQKNYYLPRLARGEEIPCFALTSPDAGSDAGSMTDHGIVCWGDHEGQKTLGIRLNWNKRYITLAPIATVIGLAFKLYDPDHLLGSKKDIGITCALIPRHTPGITIGRRHLPISAPFQNGPIQGKDVFIPIDWIIGGQEQAGHGWRMLMECLASGRAITLPASALGGSKMGSFTAGAYALIRKQFHVSIGKFEGIQTLLARSAVYTYIIDALRLLVIGSIHAGEKPAIASAIVKYHATELGRKVACDAMDIHGGKTICLGPKNYLAHTYQSCPIAITVEGANVLTRNMIIFGQGAIRCHPYVLAEIEAAQLEDTHEGLKRFDQAIFKHLGFVIRNLMRSIVLGLTSARFVNAPGNEIKRYLQHATRFSSALALAADVSMLSMGGQLKRRENCSARLGDVLSYLYIVSAVLKHYDEHGCPKEDLPVVRYACEYSLFEIQNQFDSLFKNYPNRFLGLLLKMWIFPLGMRFSAPKDHRSYQIAKLMMAPSSTRDRIVKGVYQPTHSAHVLANVMDALSQTIKAEPIDELIKEAKKEGLIRGYTPRELAEEAKHNKIISEEQFNIWNSALVARDKVISVDDF